MRARKELAPILKAKPYFPPFYIFLDTMDNSNGSFVIVALDGSLMSVVLWTKCA